MRSSVLIWICLAGCTLGLPSQITLAESDPVLELLSVSPDHAHALDVNEFRLLHVLSEGPLETTEGHKMQLRRQGKGFIDLTDHMPKYLGSDSPPDKWEWPSLRYQTTVRSVLSYLKTSRMIDNLTKLTSFFNRDYKSEYGRSSSHWLFLNVLDIIAHAPPHLNLSIRKFTHRFPQSSIVARFEPPAVNTSHLPVVIIGAHQDSLNYRLPNLPAPGADDDGSGTVTILEAFHALVESGFQPKLPVEFHWYAGEEGGLLGSQAISQDYDERSAPIKAMLQFDMTAYTKKEAEPTVTIVTSDVTQSLTKFCVDLAKEYAAIKVEGHNMFPGAGSDHMSWYFRGYPAAFATEGDPYKAFDPYIHTTGDRMDIPEFSFEHAIEFSKLAVAFAVELGNDA